MKIYRNRKTNEIVYEEDLEQYVLDKLGVSIEPKGEHGEMTQEQMTIIENILEDYMYNDWTEEYIEDDEPSVFQLINEECYYDDEWRN